MSKPSNSANSQRQRLLKHFKEVGCITTVESREQLGIMSPAPRVQELRALGYDITLLWVNQIDCTGQPHRAGLYVYNMEADNDE